MDGDDIDTSLFPSWLWNQNLQPEPRWIVLGTRLAFRTLNRLVLRVLTEGIRVVWDDHILLRVSLVNFGLGISRGASLPKVEALGRSHD